MMRTKLRHAEFINIAPHNPTQTSFNRFVKTAKAPLHSAFKDSQDQFMNSRKSVMRTWVSDLLEESLR